ncbi:hypothetical protein [Micromonospora ureilytica]|uniref:hypothetical protein n=1 Tax=Micromonospora ureilytica TaxID=709868 RepID=UPI004039960F
MAELPLWTVLRSRDEFDDADLPLLTVKSDFGVELRDMSQGRQPSEDMSTYRVVQAGDLVVNRLWARFGAYGAARQAGIISPAYWVFRVDGSRIEPRFLHYLLRSAPYRHEIGRRSKNMPPNGFELPWEQFRKITIPELQLQEQRRIADFLDAETALMHRAVEVMHRQVDVLAERRMQALDVVWPVDPDAPTKRLGYGTQLVTSGSRGWAEFVGDAGSLFFRSANLRRDSLSPNLTSLAYVQLPPSVAAEASRSRISEGDVLVGITGANTGWVTLVDDSVKGGNVSQHVCLVRPVRGEIHGRWLAFLIASPTIQTELMGSQYGGTKTQLSLPDIRDLRVPVLPFSRQKELAAEVDGLLENLDKQRDLRNRQLGVLAERRQALITAAVTGQIDVSTASGRGIED